MRKLVVQMQMSVDGYVAAANGDLQWQVWGFGDNWPWDDALKSHFNAVIASVDCILLSRKMLEEAYLEHWGKAARKHAADPHYAAALDLCDRHLAGHAADGRAGAPVRSSPGHGVGEDARRVTSGVGPHA